MKISKIEWISEGIKEAVVEVTDGKFSVKCFSQPLNYPLDSEINDPLYCYDVNYIVKSYENTYKVEKLSSYFAYNFIGKLVDKNNNRVKVGEIFLELDLTSLPGDINEGDYIQFECSRLDLY